MCSIGHFVENLYSAENFNSAFQTLETEVLNMGFDGVLYTFIPEPLISSGFKHKPVCQVSKEFAPGYLKHYTGASFEKHDPLIKALADDVQVPITWWGDICQSYMQQDSRSREVMEVSKDYGISNGVTLPLMSGPHGMSGVSVISFDSKKFDLLIDSKLTNLKQRIQLFHSFVISHPKSLEKFVKPMISSLNKTEINYLAGLAMGRSQAQIATELKLSNKYLEQIMLRIRRKVSGVGKHDKPTINRNQLLYYTGLFNILDKESLSRFS